MTGQPFLRALLGPNASIVFEAAFGADLSDVDGSGWTWTDLGSDPRHDPGVPITVGRSDNVAQAGAASFSTTLNNAAGDYTPGNPVGAHDVVQNTPIRERITLDGSTWFTRYQGFLDSANPANDQSAKVKGISFTALGALGRLGGLKKPLRSALYRAITPTAPVAYWPMEDGASSGTIASGVDGGQAMTITTSAAAIAGLGVAGTVALASVDAPGSLPAPDFSGGGSMTGPVSMSPSATAWRVGCAVNFDTFTGGNYTCIASIQATGGASVWRLAATDAAGGGIFVDYIDQSGNFGVLVESDVGVDDRAWHWITLDAVKSGSNTVITVMIDGVTVISQTYTGLAWGVVTRITANPMYYNDIQLSTLAAKGINHLGVWAPWSSSVDLPAATQGYSGETADERLARLCAEQSIALDLIGTSNTTMGPQSADAILDLLRECEAADHGVLYDGLGPGLGYQCRSARYNAASVLTLDMASEQVATFAPKFDKQSVKNLYVVSRKGGSNATAEKADGPLGTSKIGIEDGAATVNIDSDDALPGHAGWLVLLGTQPGFRFPLTGLNMRSISSLAAAVLGLRIGDRITIANPTSKDVDLPPDDIDLIVEGWTETTTTDSWGLALNCSPARPYQVATVDGSWRVDAASSSLHQGYTATVTSLLVDSARPWTTTATFPADLPFDIEVASERMTVTAIVGASSPQTFTVIRSVNGVVKSQDSGAQVKLWRPPVIGL